MTTRQIAALLFFFFCLTHTTPSALAQNPPIVKIDGVYTGTYMCAQGPTDLTLTLYSSGASDLAGNFIFYLPPSSRTNAYSYILKGTFDAASGKFKLSPVKWDGPVPAGFTMVGLQGVFDSASKRVSGKITNAACGAFQATRIEAGSSSISAKSSPKATPPAAGPPSSAASQQKPTASSSTVARAPTATTPGEPKKAALSSNKTPVNSASNPPLSAGNAKSKVTSGLVRKSQRYWNAYETDLIRQVFDGIYGDDMDSDSHFRVMFNTYVEMFAKHCHSSLPSHYEAVTVTRSTETRNGYGTIVNEQVDQQWTVDVDPRFVTKYKKYSAAPLASPGEAIRQTLSIASGRSSFGSYTALGDDIDEFFRKETCPSATMRQLAENLLRAAHGDPSLQSIGATIPGASAESDADASTQRFTNLRDGCVAYFHAPTTHYPGNDMSSWCECLEDHYQSVTTAEEESRYANDFEGLFWNGIAAPKSNDPAWPRLHPIVVQCQR